MSYPILPLTPTWGNPEQEQADVAKTKYGKAGVEQRDFIGINPLSTSWDISVNIRNFQEVDDFLLSRRGQPFRLSLDGGITDDGKFYICTEWQIQQLGIGAGSFNAKINQVRRLQPLPFAGEGSPGVAYRIMYKFEITGDGGPYTFFDNQIIDLWGVIGEFQTIRNQGTINLFLECQGDLYNPYTPSPVLVALTGYSGFTPESDIRNISIISINPL
ncbi:MAG: phage tail protein [Tolypothrix brevis GSE-NOS-MK-07-07A]|jgi:phage-related protein|nr:phage tail protein [Tolypothrix brevis GSE-NOS-MK-07-07A]